MAKSVQSRVYFSGYYGMQNFGDDLFGLICSSAAVRYWKASPCLVGPHIPGVDTDYIVPKCFSAKQYGASSFLGKASRFLSFSAALARADVLVLGGGSVVHSRESFRHPLMVKAKQNRKLQIGAVGISIGPFENSTAQSGAAKFLDKFDYVSVRDRRSYELALDMGLGERLHQGKDLAGMLQLVTTPPSRRTMDANVVFRIGVALCNYRPYAGYHSPDIAKLIPALVEALASLARERQLCVDIFCLNAHASHGDAALSSDLKRRLLARGVESSVIPYSGVGPVAMVDRISRCNAMVSARLHGAIVSYMQGIPFAIIDYHPKCRDFSDDIGLSLTRSIRDENSDAASLSSMLNDLLSDSSIASFSAENYADHSIKVFTSAPWSDTASARE